MKEVYDVDWLRWLRDGSRLELVNANSRKAWSLNMCWGRRLPSVVESLEVLADLIWIIFSGGDPLNPP